MGFLSSLMSWRNWDFNLWWSILLSSWECWRGKTIWERKSWHLLRVAGDAYSMFAEIWEDCSRSPKWFCRDRWCTSLSYGCRAFWRYFAKFRVTGTECQCWGQKSYICLTITSKSQNWMAFKRWTSTGTPMASSLSYWWSLWMRAPIGILPLHRSFILNPSRRSP